ncbi:MAG: DUF1080 domain-containing protein, partial [Verrucomicrobiota bacterium]
GFWIGSTTPEMVVGTPQDGWAFSSGMTWSVNEEGLTLNQDGESIPLQKLHRQSPTANASPPEGAKILFDGSAASLEHWKNGKRNEHGFLQAGTSTVDHFGDFHLHLEFRQPYKPTTPLGNQDRGNSGLYIFNRYECQVLDSFGAHFFHQPEGEWEADFEAILRYAPPSLRTQWCGSFYKKAHPRVNACLPALAWQTYDIDFTAPRFEGEIKISSAQATVRLNGILIHEDIVLEKGTGNGGKRPEVPDGGLYLQAHGNPVVYRHIWIVEK